MPPHSKPMLVSSVPKKLGHWFQRKKKPTDDYNDLNNDLNNNLNNNSDNNSVAESPPPIDRLRRLSLPPTPDGPLAPVFLGPTASRNPHWVTNHEIPEINPNHELIIPLAPPPLKDVVTGKADPLAPLVPVSKPELNHVMQRNQKIWRRPAQPDAPPSPPDTPRTSLTESWSNISVGGHCPHGVLKKDSNRIPRNRDLQRRKSVTISENTQINYVENKCKSRYHTTREKIANFVFCCF